MEADPAGGATAAPVVPRLLVNIITNATIATMAKTTPTPI
jgi:hypothetical protein